MGWCSRIHSSCAFDRKNEGRSALKIPRIREKYFETAKKSLDNSNAWLNVANYLLFEKKSYGHSCALSIFSIEETTKALVCFSVAIGSADPKDEIVETVFRYHYDKMEILLGLSLHLSVPLLTKMFSKLEEKDLEEIAELYQQISPQLEKDTKDLVKLRTKAMYVDLVEGKISTPESISQSASEIMFVLALAWNRQWGEAINKYQAASQEEKIRRIEFAKKITLQFMENIRKLEQPREKKQSNKQRRRINQ